MAGGDDELTRRREGEEILMTIEAFPDGSVAISPDFCQESDGEPYRVERRDGSVWEYGVTNASTRDETPLEKRQKDIAPTAAMRAMQLARRRRAGPARCPRGCRRASGVPGRDRLRARLRARPPVLRVGAGVRQGNLVRRVAGGHQTSAPEPVVAGATQISKTAVYPSDALSGTRHSRDRATASSPPSAWSRTGPRPSSCAWWRGARLRRASTPSSSSR